MSEDRSSAWWPPSQGEWPSRHSAILIGLLAVVLACWFWLALMARDMYGSMSGLSAWTMTDAGTGEYVILLAAMWMVMMAAMMLPSATPLVVLYAAVLRKQPAPQNGLLPVTALASGYLCVWGIFSIAATALQRVLAEWLVLTPMMEPARPQASGALMIAAGIYQLTPFKTACLGVCRSPFSFILHRWRPGTWGAFRIGIEHGFYCVGCCWALMLLLFAGGVMNLYVIVALTAAVLVEKLAPFGVQTGRGLGVMLIGVGTVFLFR